MSELLAEAPMPFGATYLGNGKTLFALYAGAGATKVEVCLFNSVNAPSESSRFELGERSQAPWPECQGQIHFGETRATLRSPGLW